MGMLKKEQCPICGRDTGSLKKSAVKKVNAYICSECYFKLTSSGVGIPKIKELSAEELIQILNGTTITDIQGKKNINYDMKTAEGLYQFCVDSGYGQGMTKLWGEKHFQLIVDNLKEDEEVILAFIGMHNYRSISKHDNNFAYVLTNKRFILAQKKLIGETFQSISLDHINDVTFDSGTFFGILTVDTFKEKFNVALDRFSAKNINNRLHQELDRLHLVSKPQTSHSPLSVPDEIKKYKELLDMGAITQEEFDTKKKELLNL